MKLKQEVIEKIKRDKVLKDEIGRIMNVKSVQRWSIIKNNLPNGPLTKIAVLTAISKKLGISIPEMLC
jgi:hypothetical protein